MKDSGRSLDRPDGRAPLAAASRSAKVTRSFDNPSPRYFVHLHAPGWNVIGATHPWMPGVAIGHNDRVAWAASPIHGEHAGGREREGGWV